jgi:hypothetical protein
LAGGAGDRQVWPPSTLGQGSGATSKLWATQQHGILLPVKRLQVGHHRVERRRAVTVGSLFGK